MNLKKWSALVVTVVALTLSALLLLETPPAMASLIFSPSVNVNASGEFQLSLETKGESEEVVRSAVLGVPSGGKGIIKNIKITEVTPQPSNPSGIVFGCVNILVKNKSNLIKDCGGPAPLKRGTKYKYEASGSGFKPNSSFKISLYNEFNEGL
jgi:hypothetical protein